MHVPLVLQALQLVVLHGFFMQLLLLEASTEYPISHDVQLPSGQIRQLLEQLVEQRGSS